MLDDKAAVEQIELQVVHLGHGLQLAADQALLGRAAHLFDAQCTALRGEICLAACRLTDSRDQLAARRAARRLRIARAAACLRVYGFWSMVMITAIRHGGSPNYPVAE
ncbi:hypothetical protein Pstr01_30310 [Pseudomonas straminea]|nr:hypothetical protein Pstr01_30310 [Pseudomonas straminea]